ncbi:MAG: hypothetical protein P8Y52_01910 [Xanthomonadales bacterium]
MRDVYLANTPVRGHDPEVQGDIVRRDGSSWFRIGHYDRMPPFFIAVVSGHDHWMYVSSTGGLTCGRGNPDNALFPYETDDRIHDAWATAGPATFLLAERGGETRLWRPFDRSPAVYRRERHLYKSLTGNRLAFEEINHDLGLSFAYEWSTGDRFGFIRTATLRELDGHPVTVRLLDGIRNLLPYGVSSSMQANRSTLVDAYRQAEVEPATRAGLFSLSSIPTDRAEPSEALKATVAWSTGLKEPEILLSLDQIDAFCRGEAVTAESRRTGRRGDYLVHTTLELAAGAERQWRQVADVALGPSAVVALLDAVSGGIAPSDIDDDIEAGARRIRELVGRADGFQHSARPLTAARHFSNTLFNVMRGGVFRDEYRFPADDFLRFVEHGNRPLTKRFEALLAGLGDAPDRARLVAAAAATGDPDMERLALEYLPLTFSRRHGDPSRPWNYFNIDLRDADGRDRLGFEGNWRDIFQNWEALALSHPEYIEHFIAKFVNASTPDGHNPYRITRNGIDWEVLDPDDPWSNIGYWGDHQVIYLLALLELSQRYHPGALADWLEKPIFVYADVPYRIKGYRDLLRDPRASVRYDADSATRSARRVREIGSDGRLVVTADGTIHHVTLLEKLLVVILAKLAGLVPDGGIWMNTQRPEWNDANNALVGYGLSMVTLYQLRRFLDFLARLIERDAPDAFDVSSEVRDVFEAIESLFEDGPVAPGEAVDDAARKQFMDRMGAVAETWRDAVYAGPGGRTGRLATGRLHAFLERARALLDDSIERNRRSDGLFHSYNLLRIGAQGHAIEHLQEMLEGQVAVLGCGLLSPAEGADLLDRLRASRLYRSDQNGYTLYPDTPLPGFLEKNVIPADRVANNAFLSAELESGRTDIVERDGHGRLHFNGRFRNAAELRAALEQRDGPDDAAVDETCALFEDVFEHHRFTGRSGSMHKYEGLGCIYWHMNSKLLLAVGELLSRHTDDADRDRLAAHYGNIRAGLGAGKSPADYGAFPTDPYSHTPRFAGVQQPGMTGQVKEDIISRFGELGVRVRNGDVRFEPVYLQRAEFTSQASAWRYAGARGASREDLEPGTLAFQFCGVPIVYRIAEATGIRIYGANGAADERTGPGLGPEWSAALFRRDGSIRRIEVAIDARRLR